MFSKFLKENDSITFESYWILFFLKKSVDCYLIVLSFKGYKNLVNFIRDFFQSVRTWQPVIATFLSRYNNLTTLIFSWLNLMDLHLLFWNNAFFFLLILFSNFYIFVWVHNYSSVNNCTIGFFYIYKIENDWIGVKNNFVKYFQIKKLLIIQCCN